MRGTVCTWPTPTPVTPWDPYPPLEEVYSVVPLAALGVLLRAVWGVMWGVAVRAKMVCPRPVPDQWGEVVVVG